MARHVLVVHSEPVEGREHEYHEWYENVHLADILTLPGFVSARRFAAVPGINGEAPERRYLAIYEIDTEDVETALQALRDAHARQAMHVSSALDRANSSSFVYTQISALG